MQATFSLTKQIMIAMIAAIVLGTLTEQVAQNWPAFQHAVQVGLIDGLFWLIGKVFIASLKLLVVPLVLVSLICGAASLGGGAQLGRMGTKTIVLYLITTAVAITLAMLAAYLIQPGVGANLESTSEFAVKESKPLMQVLADIFPTNPISAMADGNMLQIIIFALLLGVALNHSGEAGQRIKSNFEDWNEVVMKLITMLMKLAPYGVFALLFNVFAEKGLGTITELAAYFFTVVIVLIIQAFVIYPGLLLMLAQLSPVTFLAKMRNVQLFAFSTASSSATLPVTMRTVEKRLGVDNKIASFTTPLGATLNMDGTAIMQGVATVFIAQAYGADFGLTAALTVVAMATMATIGTAGVPGVGLITLSMVLTQVDLNPEGIALIIGVDRLLDMMRTAVNVTGDAAVSCIVAKSEGQLDLDTFNDPDAGAVEAES